jgi:hypothetical protein
MITLIYTVDFAAAKDEQEWLNQIKVYPSTRQTMDLHDHTIKTMFCCIVAPETANIIKLRHPVQLQQNYKQR